MNRRENIEKALLLYMNQNLPISDKIKAKINNNINAGNCLK